MDFLILGEKKFKMICEVKYQQKSYYEIRQSSEE
jgi:hypothetical protein